MSALVHEKLGCGLGVVASAVVVLFCMTGLLPTTTIVGPKYWPAVFQPVHTMILTKQNTSHKSNLGRVMQEVSRAMTKDSGPDCVFTRLFAVQDLECTRKSFDLVLMNGLNKFTDFKTINKHIQKKDLNLKPPTLVCCPINAN
jgi:hypothetical protein